MGGEVFSKWNQAAGEAAEAILVGRGYPAFFLPCYDRLGC